MSYNSLKKILFCCSWTLLPGNTREILSVICFLQLARTIPRRRCQIFDASRSHILIHALRASQHPVELQLANFDRCILLVAGSIRFAPQYGCAQASCIKAISTHFDVAQSCCVMFKKTQRKQFLCDVQQRQPKQFLPQLTDQINYALNLTK